MSPFNYYYYYCNYRDPKLKWKQKEEACPGALRDRLKEPKRSYPQGLGLTTRKHRLPATSSRLTKNTAQSKLAVGYNRKTRKSR